MSTKTKLDTKAEETFLRDWASRNKAAYQDEGSCGFGRECVGIEVGDNWVALGPTVTKQFTAALAPDTYEDQDIHDDAWPPDGVENAYHKHNCLAVLGRGPDAIHELYLWVKNLSDKGFTIGRTNRMPKSEIDLFLHGASTPHLVAP